MTKYLNLDDESIDNKYWKYYQPNTESKGDQECDCVIRALTKVLNKSWNIIFMDLNKYISDNKIRKSVINHKLVYGKLL